MGQLTGTDAEHPASGEVTIEGSKLKFSNASITEAPDAQVFLANDYDKEGSGVLVESLKSFTGDQEYDLPAEVDPLKYNTVVIWCDEFSVPIGKAPLP